MKRSQGFPFAKAALVLLILASVNLLGMRFHHRWDLTEEREFTLSPSTRHVLGRLDDVVTIKVYFSKELPSYFANMNRQVKDMLDEYRSAGDSRVQVEWIDPGSSPALEQSVRMLGIPKLQLSRYQKEKAEVMNAYLGIAVQYHDKTEVIPVVQNVDHLEYDLTASVIKVSGDRKTVGIATAGKPGGDDTSKTLQQLLQKQYNVQTVDVEANPVPPTLNTLIVPDDDAFSDRALYRIDRFVMGGGKLLALCSGVDVNLSTLSARNRQPKIGMLLRSYGIGVDNALVADGQCPTVGFDVGFFLPLTVRYPWFPQVTEKRLNRKQPITSAMQSLVLPWTSPLTPVPVDSSGGASVRVDTLAVSSEQSFARTAPYDLNPQSRVEPPRTGMHPLLLAAALSGRFPTHWPKGAAIPGDSTGTAPPGPAVSPENQIVVVGSSSFIDPRFLKQYPSNAVFLANSVDWMTLGTDLIAMRSRGAASRPLQEIGDKRKATYKMLAMIPVPILVVLFGLGRMRLRRERRLRYAVEFGGRA